MTFGNLWTLHFLWFLPVVTFFLILEKRKRDKTLEKFAEKGLLMRLTGELYGRRRFVKGFLLLLSLALLVFALAGPRWGSHFQEVSRRGVDIAILVDVSPSMLVADIKPSRIERARREIIDFLRVAQGDRIGLVAFSGAAFIQCPLTLDYGALEMFLGSVAPDLIPVPGTDLGAAIDTGLSVFDYKVETDKVLLLITDGEDNENKGIESAKEAAKKGVKIFVFGIGEVAGGPIPLDDGGGGFMKDREGNLVLSRLNENGLRQIASSTGGSYVRSTTGDLDLDMIYFDGIRSKTEARDLKSGKIKVYEERFYIFIIAAIFLLILEGLIVERRREN
ncbi:MAG: VWA domain-containing protein [Deltaproteobacteria bacterium]|nr:VWA domain-containing protein [Deltaproteobacteria bacterium]